jgi:uncharacterized protein (TIGR02172 family)
MTLTSLVQDNRLILKPEGRIDTTTAPDFQTQALAIISQTAFSALVIDLAKVAYISSAGLRVFLLLSKQLTSNQQKISLINASSELMEIFQMTGFSEMLAIRPSYRPFSIEGLKRIGGGMCGDVYKVDDETILKLYKSNMDLEMILKEKDNAKEAFVLGVPTAISYEIVQVGERVGILFEMLKAQDLVSLMKNDLDHIQKYAEMFATLAKKVHSIDAAKSRLPHKKDEYWANFAKSTWMNDEERAKMKQLIEELPDTTTVVHGDFHPGNTMLSGGELMFIDMGDVSTGSPYNDIAQVYSLYKKDEPRSVIDAVIKIDDEHRHLFYHYFMDAYFDHPSPEELAHHEEIVQNFMTVRNLFYILTFPDQAEIDETLVRERLKNYSTPQK